jgi:GTPase SAR1 family protein
MSQPLTPTRLSPHPESIAPSTPRSSSPKSFRLSDEDETNSQALQSSNGDDDDGSVLERTPQLVMPSLAMPSRRPFTESGRNLGRAKILVVGPKGVGKTSFIASLLRSSEDVVHVDYLAAPVSVQASFITEASDINPTPSFTEITASTRPYPSWWTDFETRRMLHRRKSVGEGVLERNLTFIDTPSLEDERSCNRILDYVKDLSKRTARMESMADNELINLLSGDGGVQIDAVIYMFEPTAEKSPYPSSAHQDLIQYLCKSTNLIPLIGRADELSPEDLKLRRDQVMELLNSIKAEPYKLGDLSEQPYQEPFAVSSAHGDDTDVIDASILMSSQYVPPLVPSELNTVAECLFTPENMARLRHVSATKFLLWRQENLGFHLDLKKQALLQSPQLGYQTTEATSSGSCAEEPSKVLVPHSSSSYYRSISPAISDNSALSGAVMGTSAFALAKYNEEAQTTEPFRQVRLAKWAQDLQRSLNNERRRYQQMYANAPAEWQPSEDENTHAMVTTKEGHRPPRGRLGGDLGVIDPRDPLGVLSFAQAFRRRGFLTLQIVGGCGLVGAVAYWVARNWMDVQDFFGFSQPAGVVHAVAVPAPPSSSRYTTPISWLEATPFGGLLGWSR